MRTINSKMAQNDTILDLDPLDVSYASNSFYMRACNHCLEDQKVTTIATAVSERRKRLRLKRIVVSEHNYHALKKVGYAGDSFNDVISKLLRIYCIYQEKQKQLQQKQEESDDGNSSNSSNRESLFPPGFSEMIDERSRQREADLVRLLLQKRKSNSNNTQTIKQESNNAREP
jgi:predicted CopG family antitoxin